MIEEKSAARPWGRWRRVGLRVAGVIIGLYVAVIALLVVFEGRMIFVPLRDVPAITPAVDGLKFEDLHIPVKSGGFVHAWWIPSADPHARTILYFHGNAGCWRRKRILRCRCFGRRAQIC